MTVFCPCLAVVRPASPVALIPDKSGKHEGAIASLKLHQFFRLGLPVKEG
jgi:hypothetical protein